MLEMRNWAIKNKEEKLIGVVGFDNGIVGSSWRVGRQCGGMQLGNVFEVFNTDSISPKFNLCYRLFARHI